MPQKGFGKTIGNKTDTMLLLYNTEYMQWMNDIELVSGLHPITDTDYHFYNLEGNKEEEEGCLLSSGGDVSNAAAPVVVVTGHWSA